MIKLNRLCTLQEDFCRSSHITEIYQSVTSTFRFVKHQTHRHLHYIIHLETGSMILSHVNRPTFANGKEIVANIGIKKFHFLETYHLMSSYDTNVDAQNY
jgi:hypothetical protein